MFFPLLEILLFLSITVTVAVFKIKLLSKSLGSFYNLCSMERVHFQIFYIMAHNSLLQWFRVPKLDTCRWPTSLLWNVNNHKCCDFMASQSVVKEKFIRTVWFSIRLFTQLRAKMFHTCGSTNKLTWCLMWSLNYLRQRF